MPQGNYNQRTIRFDQIVYFLIVVNFCLSVISFSPPRPYKVRWTEEEQGVVLGAYSYTYAALQILCGRLSDKYDATHVSTVSHILSLLCTVLTPLSVNGGIATTIAVRLVQGIVQAPIISTLYVIYAQWFPPNEVGLPIAGLLIGSNIGSALVMPITAWLCPFDQYWEGWPLSFYLFSGLNVIFVILWMIFVTKDPRDNRWISKEELEYITSTRTKKDKKKVEMISNLINQLTNR